ncbi:MAG: polyprenyl synthetase family protein [Candidatus Kapabacteria bacterium]|nr:polyprenyl synthetase family protein [Candidatus Kapabacteria bacterium]
MMTLNDIIKPVKDDLKEFSSYFKGTLNTNVPLLNLIIKYVAQRKGKQLRPILVFLSAKICGEVNPRSFVGASLVELLHSATLIHDDVVDEASERRGLASINAKWNNKIAVLIGDFLLSKGLLTAIDNEEFDFLHAVSVAVKRMSEGELLSIDKSRSTSIDEETYFRIIGDKTASLLSSCCKIGAMSATTNTEYHQALSEYGENIGIAFQIKDDMLDYTSRSVLIGKPVGNDIKEKKITLPLLYALSKLDENDADKIKKRILKGKMTKGEIVELIEQVVQMGGIDYAERIAKEYVDKAKSYLEIFPESPAKTSFLQFADFVILRTN